MFETLTSNILKYVSTWLIKISHLETTEEFCDCTFSKGKKQPVLHIMIYMCTIGKVNVNEMFGWDIIHKNCGNFEATQIIMYLKTF